MPTTAPASAPRPTEPAAQPTSAPTPTLAAVTPPSNAPAPAGSNDARGLGSIGASIPNLVTAESGFVERFPANFVRASPPRPRLCGVRVEIDPLERRFGGEPPFPYPAPPGLPRTVEGLSRRAHVASGGQGAHRPRPAGGCVISGGGGAPHPLVHGHPPANPPR